MTQISIGAARYDLICDARDGQWTARVTRADTGDPFGIECAGPTEAEAAARLTRWLEWQSAHAAALAALQQAERAYHRTIAGNAFAGATEGPGAIELQKESIGAVDAARVQLDEVRGRKPE